MSEQAQIASEIAARIQALNNLMEEDLSNEMASLKQALLANPAACLLIKDEDVGLLVQNLRRILNIAVASAASPKTKAPAKSKKLTAEELAAALEDM